jgi:transposase
LAKETFQASHTAEGAKQFEPIGIHRGRDTQERSRRIRASAILGPHIANRFHSRQQNLEQCHFCFTPGWFMLTLPSSVRIFIYTQPADMRCGFNKLSMFANNIMDHDPFSGHLFVYFNKRGDKCKILFWDRTGFCIWYKRLEEGSFERISNPSKTTSLEIDMTTLSLILEGIDISNAKQRKRYKRRVYS